MCGMLERVMVCSPRAAGWDQPERAARWQELGFQHAPDFLKAQSQHEALCHELEAAGAEVVEMPPATNLSLDAVYTHDASLPTDYGLIVMRPGKPNRVAEGPHHGSFCETLDIPTLGTITPPGTTEAGDIVWLDPTTLLIGRSYRTNAEGIQSDPRSARAQRCGCSFRSSALRTGPIRLPAPDVADQPARRAHRAGRFALARGRDR